MLTIKAITTEGKELDIIRELFTAYQAELGEDLCFQSFEKELENPLKKYVMPGGLLLLAYWNNDVSGCIALQPLGNNACEMKRLYVKPSFRKHKIGKSLCLYLLKQAKQFGYDVMKLDTLQKLQPAIKLYRQLGFIETTAYYNNPISNVVYMQINLHGADHDH